MTKTRLMQIAAAALLVPALLLSACSGPTVPATPALWEVNGPDGQQAYLFGTIHALPADVAWQSQPITDALDKSDRLVLEIRQLDDLAQMQAIFTRLAETPGQAPLSGKVGEGQRAQLARLLKQTGFIEAQFDNLETWAAALTLAQAAQSKPSGEAVDRVLMTMAKGKPVTELEGTEQQLGLFDRLPETEQRDLLNAVVAEAAEAGQDERRLETLWRNGDMGAITQETRRGMLADPELRQALLVQRNQDWVRQLTTMLKARQRPFVAVGAAHMAGADGLPALLTRQGYTIRRVQ